jgi:hypothetical protein
MKKLDTIEMLVQRVKFAAATVALGKTRPTNGEQVDSLVVKVEATGKVLRAIAANLHGVAEATVQSSLRPFCKFYDAVDRTEFKGKQKPPFLPVEKYLNARPVECEVTVALDDLRRSVSSFAVVEPESWIEFTLSQGEMLIQAKWYPPGSGMISAEDAVDAVIFPVGPSPHKIVLNAVHLLPFLKKAESTAVTFMLCTTEYGQLVRFHDYSGLNFYLIASSREAIDRQLAGRRAQQEEPAASHSEYVVFLNQRAAKIIREKLPKAGLRDTAAANAVTSYLLKGAGKRALNKISAADFERLLTALESATPEHAAEILRAK